MFEQKPFKKSLYKMINAKEERNGEFFKTNWWIGGILKVSLEHFLKKMHNSFLNINLKITFFSDFYSKDYMTLP